VGVIGAGTEADRASEVGGWEWRGLAILGSDGLAVVRAVLGRERWGCGGRRVSGWARGGRRG